VYLPVNAVVGPDLNNRRRAFLTMLGRLRDNVTTEQAQASLVPQMQALERAFPTDNIDLGRRPPFFFPVSGLGSWRTRDMPIGSLIAITTVPFIVFGFVLLIACVNVAGLLLARGIARRREIAIRLAMGASRWAVIRTLLAESFLLSALGSTVGLVLAFWLTSLTSLIRLPLVRVPPEINPDLGVALYAIGLMLITTLICGLTPAIASTNPDLANALKRDAAQAQHRLTSRNTLVRGQIALSTLLLFVSTLFLRSLNFISTVDPGFNIDNVITARIDMDPDRYPADQQPLFAMRAVEVIQSLPGILSASITNLIPLGGDVYGTSFELQGKTAPRIETYYMNVGPGYFRTIETVLRLGREFNATDRAGSTPVAIVNEAFVRKYALGPNAIGAQVRSTPTDAWMEIVGVVADSKYAFFGEVPSPILYRPILQAGGNFIVVARTAGPPAGTSAAVRSAIQRLDSSVIVEPRTMRDATSLEFSFRRLGACLMGVIGALGLALALIGLYGTLSYTVKRRMPEIGIRMALGASRLAIHFMILRSGFWLVASGVTIGILLSVPAARPLSFLMSGIPAYDPLTITITSILLLITGLGASYFPSRRAARTDPMVVLRYE
jgi:predicted permease